MGDVGSGATVDPSAPDGDPAGPTVVGAPVIRRRRRLLRRLPYVAVGAAAAIWLVGDAGPWRPDHPDRWDERILDLVAFVEVARGLRFDHPVALEFVSAEEFTRQRRIRDDDLRERDRALFEDARGISAALGLIPQDTDLLAASKKLSDGGSGGYYDPANERIVMLGPDRELDPLLRSGLVHDLVHALQDQHFEVPDVAVTSEIWSTYRTIIEGDAVRVATSWHGALTAAEKEAYADAFDDASLETVGVVEDVPASMLASWSFRYVVGEKVVMFLRSRGGNAAVDEALRRPPASVEQLRDPRALLEGDEPRDAGSPRLPAGARDIDQPIEIDAFTLQLVLSTRIDPVTALGAADGWGGSTTVPYELEGRTCVAARLVGDRRSDTDEIRTALQAWAAAGPRGAATIEPGPGPVEVHACTSDAGREATVVDEEGPQAAVDVISARIDVMTGLVLQWGYTDAEAFAAADCYVRATYPISKDPALDEETKRSRYRQMWTTCGLPDPPPF